MIEQLIEQRSRKAARILDSARELVLDHGVRKVTVSEIARTAGVGKGTVYLYWAAKEDLILGLFARELLTFLDEIIARIAADPATVLPRRLAPLLIRTELKLPLASRLKSDAGLLRQQLQQADRDLFARMTPSSVCDAAMPIFRRRGLIRDDRPLASQTYAVYAVLTGFGINMSDPTMAPPGVGDPAEVLADTVAQQFEPSVEPAEPAIAAAADEVIAVLRESRDAVLELIESSQLVGE